MTIASIAVSATSTISGVVTVFAVLDPAVTNIALAVVGLIGVITPLWFKYKSDALTRDLDNKTAALQREVDDAKRKQAEAEKKLESHAVSIAKVEATSDGMKTELVKVAEKLGYAEGTIAGIDKAKADAAVQAVAKAEGAAEHARKGEIVKEISHDTISITDATVSGKTNAK